MNTEGAHGWQGLPCGFLAWGKFLHLLQPGSLLSREGTAHREGLPRGPDDKSMKRCSLGPQGCPFWAPTTSSAPLVALSRHCRQWKRSLTSRLTSSQLLRPCLTWGLAGLPGKRSASTQTHGTLAFQKGGHRGPSVQNCRPNSAHPLMTPQRTGCSPSPRRPELWAIPGAHALGGHTGQPLSAQCLAPSRLHSHVKNARVQAGGGPGLCGRKRVGLGVEGVCSRTLPSPSAAQEKQVAPGDGGVAWGLAGVGTGFRHSPCTPSQTELNVRGLLMRWRS